MNLIILVLVIGVAGYFLARSRYSKPVDDTAGKVASTSKDYANKASGWWQSRFGKSSKTDPFRAWAAGPGSPNLPEDFKTWLGGLSDKEAQEFTQGLRSYANGLGYDLDKLVDGSMNAQPAKMQVFVEAVVVYSSAYRKAKQAQSEAEGSSAEAKSQSDSSDGKLPAEKSASRRKSDSAETSEATPAA